MERINFLKLCFSLLFSLGRLLCCFILLLRVPFSETLSVSRAVQETRKRKGYLREACQLLEKEALLEEELLSELQQQPLLLEYSHGSDLSGNICDHEPFEKKVEA